MENHDFSMENILRRLKVGINILSKFYASREEKYAFYRFSDNASIGSFISFLRFPSRKSKIVSVNFIFCYILSSYDECLFPRNTFQKSNFSPSNRETNYW